MLRGRKRWAALALLLHAGPALAQPSAASPPPPEVATDPLAAPDSTGTSAAAQSPADPRVAARDAYGRGQASFAAGHYSEAKAAFDQAYSLVANPVVLLSTAECDIRLGNIEQAHIQLQRYLAERPDAPDREAVEQKLLELADRPALLMLTSEPRGATITIDAVEVGAQTPAEILVAPGEHRVSFTRPGYEAASDLVQARMGARHGLRLILRASPAAPAPASVAPPAATSAAEEDYTAIWVSGILGGAGVATGTALGIMALEERDSYDRNPNVGAADRGERLALFADVAFAVGAVSLITTAVLCFTAEQRPDSARERAAASLRFTPAVLRGGAALTASTRF